MSHFWTAPKDAIEKRQQGRDGTDTSGYVYKILLPSLDNDSYEENGQ
jgi:hypothetical protein